MPDALPRLLCERSPEMGWHKRQYTALDEPKNPATLADMIHEGLLIFLLV